MSARSPGQAVSGLEALACGLLDGGLGFTTAYPGFHAHELAGLLGCPMFSANEKNALAVAWGASLAGQRTATLLKNVGLNDAADPFLNAGVLGVHAGLVLVVLDDVDVEQSQIRQDSRFYADGAPVLWLDPLSVEHAYDLARQSLEVSEQLASLVVLRVTNWLCHARGVIQRRPCPSPVRQRFQRAPERWVAHPVNVAAQQQRLAERRQALAHWVEGVYPRPHIAVDQRDFHIAVGMASQATASPDLALFTFPLPRGWLDALAASSATLHVTEHGEPFLAGKIAAALGSARVQGLSLSCPASIQQYRISDRYESLYSLLRDQEHRVIVGDLGNHTLDGPRSVDACLCYGCSVAVAAGLAVADPELRVFCVTGDAALLHSGTTALAEAQARQTPFTVVLLDNGGSRSTGGQRLPGDCAAGMSGLVWHDFDFAELSTEPVRTLLTRPAGPRGLRVIRLRLSF